MSGTDAVKMDRSNAVSPSQLTGYLAIQGFLQLVEHAVEILVGAALLVDLGDRVHDGSVVLATELASDLRE